MLGTVDLGLCLVAGKMWDENSLFFGGTRIELLGDQIIVGCNELRLIFVSN